jgi:hypothetical protein
MNRIAANPDQRVSSRPRRFILLPEETAGGAGQHRRIRRYQLTILGQGAGCRRGDPRPGASTAPGVGAIERLAH